MSPHCGIFRLPMAKTISTKEPATASAGLLADITMIMMGHGLKATTMDQVAANLQMSKRTLYEIFGSKTGMIGQVLEFITDNHRQMMETIFREAPNVMLAMLGSFKLSREYLTHVSSDFFIDLDNHYASLRTKYDHCGDKRHKLMLEVFDTGVRQGLFRPDVDYLVQSRIMEIQLESLKRMEENFPKDITLTRAFDAIILSFMRSIASPKGMKLLNRITTGSSLENWVKSSTLDFTDLIHGFRAPTGDPQLPTGDN